MNNKKNLKNILFIALVLIITGIIFLFETKKVGFHEDEVYTIASSVNPNNGLMWAYGEWKDNEENIPIWLTRDYVSNFVSLSHDNILNLQSVYMNQKYDNHPPFFYTLVHFSTILFNGAFTKYSVFIVNIIAFILSCFIIKKIFAILKKDDLSYVALILYGLSMGTISMVIFQRMYMLLTFFILLYFYLTLKLYKNDFKLNKKLAIELGITTVLGFLTQYFFAIYALFIFIIMIIKMIKNKKAIISYIVGHIVYAIIGILLFTPCIGHLFFSDRGLTNLGNSDYFKHCWDYIKHLSYAFSINNQINVLLFLVLIIFIGLIVFLFKKSKDKFITALFTIPSLFYFFIAVKMTSFQELRYVMPMIPFICFTFVLILDVLYDNFILKFNDSLVLKASLISCISFILVLLGLIYSNPLFLYEDYQKCLDIAESNKEKSFVYVYDNFFNHMQSVPEMMIYEKSLIINKNNDELQYITNNKELNTEASYILCIKNYMDNDEIINEIKNNSDFKNVELIYTAPDSNYEVGNNLYLVSK